LDEQRGAVARAQAERERDGEDDAGEQDQEGLLDEPAADVEVVHREQHDERHDRVLHDAAEQLGVADAGAATVALHRAADEPREAPSRWRAGPPSRAASRARARRARSPAAGGTCRSPAAARAAGPGTCRNSACGLRWSHAGTPAIAAMPASGTPTQSGRLSIS